MVAIVIISVAGVLFNKNQTTLMVYPNCKEGSEYVIPDSVTRIDYFAFANSQYLTSITIPETVQIIESSTFANCSKLESINIPSGLTYIGNYAFANCDKLDNIIIPNSVTYLGSEVFFYANKVVVNCEFAEQPSGWNKEWAASPTGSITVNWIG